MASEYIKKDGAFVPVGGKADIVDGKLLKPDQYYIVEGDKWVAVDYTDGLFTYVVSIKNGVKKVKAEDGSISYIVSSGEHSAHGDTIKAAREALLFKMADRDISAYRGMSLDETKTPAEWAAVYRVVTGACERGCRMFMESKGKLKKTYTLAEIIEQTKGAFGHEEFKSVVLGAIER